MLNTGPMIDYSELLKADNGQPARSIHLIDADGFGGWLERQPERRRVTVAAQKFSGKPSEVVILPGERANEWSAVAGIADLQRLSPWCLSKLAETLPAGNYRLIDAEPGAAALGWLLAHYRFDRYRKDEDAVGPRILLTGKLNQIDGAVRMAEAVSMVRDLVNTPTSDMGPGRIEQVAEEIVTAFSATMEVIRGEALEGGYPMIHAVGRAADRSSAPRLIEFTWGNPANPRVAIVGKGVCFDSGGLDIKPSAGMRLMKKDMGGAAHALALAMLVMESRLPVQLHVLIPTVENAISGNAFRPGDVLTSRAGITVEIGNTDAEGRLILADAITRASEMRPDLIIDFATLTGAARVALGPDLPALFCSDDVLAAEFATAAEAADDPLWRLPLWAGYADMLKSDIADINNAGEGGFAGAITAALFLRRFAPKTVPWAHIDTFAWRPSPKPGRPKGGEALGLRAAFAMLQARFGAPA
jgi:leucyl aminopeptidase